MSNCICFPLLVFFFLASKIETEAFSPSTVSSDIPVAVVSQRSNLQQHVVVVVDVISRLLRRDESFFLYKNGELRVVLK